MVDVTRLYVLFLVPVNVKPKTKRAVHIQSIPSSDIIATREIHHGLARLYEIHPYNGTRLFLFGVSTYFGSEENRKIDLEMLQSVFDSDQRFVVISDNKFQTHPCRFLLERFTSSGCEISRVDDLQLPSYPKTIPAITLDIFRNQNILHKILDKKLGRLLVEMRRYLRMAVTFTLFEYIRRNFENLLNGQMEILTADVEKEENVIIVVR
ncbi:hypothetical protein LOAG_05147 [Loa loa]|uniref:RWD domain-containing protein n=1 Tax=Loa loa TaxID=7209 RepID=A0A1S0U0D4_LOALO|nr:hypothetical protein LOAG_05147 [Loa loa]EFO23340.1 hypothetical protein LOAG_05147 [Loa loa]